MTTNMTDGRPGGEFAAAFDGEQGAEAEPYVRLVPPEGPDPDGIALGQAEPRPVTRVAFDPADIDNREYRLLARALTNDDLDTDHRSQMTLVQLVKFLRAAGVSVPNFPDTAGVPDPGVGTVSGLG